MHPSRSTNTVEGGRLVHSESLGLVTPSSACSSRGKEGGWEGESHRSKGGGHLLPLLEVFSSFRSQFCFPEEFCCPRLLSCATIVLTLLAFLLGEGLPCWRAHCRPRIRSPKPSLQARPRPCYFIGAVLLLVHSSGQETTIFSLVTVLQGCLFSSPVSHVAFSCHQERKQLLSRAGCSALGKDRILSTAERWVLDDS